MSLTLYPKLVLLVQAALWQDERAQTAWNEWTSQNDIDQTDVASYRMLPLVYHNLKQLQVSDPLMSRLKSTYRQTWYKNQIHFRLLAQIIQVLNNAGIPTLLLKGSALTLQHYQDYGLRPMDDVDILVRPLT